MDKKQIPLFEGVPQFVIDQLMENEMNAWRTYQQGEYVVRQDSPCRSLYILTEGILKATMTNDEGKELVVEHLSAPELLAPAFIFGSENRFPVNLIARTFCRICVIGKSSLLQCMHEHPSVMENFIARISDRCVFLSRKLNEFALQSLRCRVLAYLKTHERIANQQDVASRLGVARPSLARVLSELLKEGALRREGGAIVLVDK